MQIAYFFLHKFWQIVFQETVPSHLGFKIRGNRVVHNVPKLFF